MGVLGCADEYTVYITARCGEPTLCSFTDLTEINWGRKLDDVSEAKVVINVGGGQAGTTCCECVAKITQWCHELHIFRDGEFVWCGPVQTVEYTQDTVTVYAKDMLAWAAVRFNEDALDFCEADATTKTCALAPQDVTALGKKILQVAFADDDPCILDFIQTFPGGTNNVINYSKFEAFDQSALEQLNDIAAVGLDYTVFGRSVILQGEDPPIGSIGTITDQTLVGGENIILTKSGDLTGTVFYTRYDKDTEAAQCAANQAAGNEVFNAVPCPAVAEDTTLCYGRVERIRADATMVDANSAQQTAAAYLDAGLTGGYTIEFPAGAWLSPDTPFEINTIIPGQKVDVTLTSLCIKVFQSFRLQEMQVIISGDDNTEKVSLTLAPLNVITSLI